MLNFYLPDPSMTDSDMVKTRSLRWCSCLLLVLFRQYLHFTFKTFLLGTYYFRIIFLGEFVLYLTVFIIPSSAFRFQLCDAQYCYDSQNLLFFGSGQYMFQLFDSLLNISESLCFKYVSCVQNIAQTFIHLCLPGPLIHWIYFDHLIFMLFSILLFASYFPLPIP